MAINFNKFAQEGNEYLVDLAAELGHPEEAGRVGIVFRAVLHTLRDRLTIPESFHLLAQLPMFLKAVYVEDWKYRKQPIDISEREDFKDEVKHRQKQFGEQQFNWGKSTDEIIRIVVGSLLDYVSPEEFDDIIGQMPPEIKELLNPENPGMKKPFR